MFLHTPNVKRACEPIHYYNPPKRKIIGANSYGYHYYLLVNNCRNIMYMIGLSVHIQVDMAQTLMIQHFITEWISHANRQRISQISHELHDIMAQCGGVSNSISIVH